MTPPGGSNNRPQLATTVDCSDAVNDAVVAFWINPNHPRVVVGHAAKTYAPVPPLPAILMLDILIGLGPTLKRTISLLGSNEVALQASTRMLSISKHFAGICAFDVENKNKIPEITQNSFGE